MHEAPILSLDDPSLFEELNDVIRLCESRNKKNTHMDNRPEYSCLVHGIRFRMVDRVTFPGKVGFPQHRPHLRFYPVQLLFHKTQVMIHCFRWWQLTIRYLIFIHFLQSKAKPHRMLASRDGSSDAKSDLGILMDAMNKTPRRLIHFMRHGWRDFGGMGMSSTGGAPLCLINHFQNRRRGFLHNGKVRGP